VKKVSRFKQLSNEKHASLLWESVGHARQNLKALSENKIIDRFFLLGGVKK
jgi:hypothetical protein